MTSDGYLSNGFAIQRSLALIQTSMGYFLAIHMSVDKNCYAKPLLLCNKNRSVGSTEQETIKYVNIFPNLNKSCMLHTLVSLRSMLDSETNQIKYSKRVTLSECFQQTVLIRTKFTCLLNKLLIMKFAFAQQIGRIERSVRIFG